MTPESKLRMTLEEYFGFNRNAEGRYEYFDGEVFELSGVSAEHSTIEQLLTMKLFPIARSRGCETFNSNVPIKPEAVSTNRFPDYSLTCDKPVFIDVGGLQCLTNPKLIVEVLSNSNEKSERGEKFTEYKSIKSFEEYLLVASTKTHVTLFQKHNERFWWMSEYFPGEEFHLNTLKANIAVDDLYQGIEFAQSKSGIGTVREVG